jgi:hypothetical protein
VEHVDWRIDELPELLGLNARLTRSEQRTIINWMGMKQRVGNYASP